MVQGILSARFQPQDMQAGLGDYSSAIMHSINGQPMGGADVAQSRVANILKGMADFNAMNRTNVMMMGGPTGALVNRYMGATGSDFPTALAGVKVPIQGTTMQNGQVEPIAGAPQAAGAMAGGKEAGQQGAELQYAAPIAQAKAVGTQQGENMQMARSNQDIVNMYGKLQQDAQNTPSGMVESGIARASNVLNMPTQGAVNQATFDADLNNLYLATIRSLKGTGRIMEQELVRIAESAPKATDSNEVKIAKAQAHMQYYTDRMKTLGFDPTTGTPLGPQLGPTGAPSPSAPVNLQQPASGNNVIHFNDLPE
jgi:hypothetical protein